MAHNVHRYSAHIFRSYIAPMMQEGMCFGSNAQTDARSRRSSETDELLQMPQSVVFGLTSRKHQFDDVALYFFVEVNFADQLASAHDVFRLDNSLGLAHAACLQVGANDLLFFFLGWITNHHLEEKPIDLGFRKGVGAFLFYGVLCSEDQEGVGKVKGLRSNGDLAFLHGFQERALHFRRSSVDLISQHEIGKNRPFLHLETFFPLIVDHGANQVSWKQVGRELDAAELRLNRI